MSRRRPLQTVFRIRQRLIFSLEASRMNRSEQLKYLNQALLSEMPQYREQAEAFPGDEASRRRLLRALMNVRPPLPLSPGFLEVQDALLSAETEEKGVVDGNTLPPVPSDPRLVIWQGDISRLLGCFVPCHGCIDNAIHSAAGLQLRDECNQLMAAQGRHEPNGRAKLTKGYNLPARYVLHTVGPIVRGRVTGQNRSDLASCYRSCMELAAAHELQSVAFCCISTGEFRFPNREAAEIAVKTVREFLDRQTTSVKRVIFNVFKGIDAQIYCDILQSD